MSFRGSRGCERTGLTANRSVAERARRLRDVDARELVVGIERPVEEREVGSLGRVAQGRGHVGEHRREERAPAGHRVDDDVRGDRVRQRFTTCISRREPRDVDRGRNETIVEPHDFAVGHRIPTVRRGRERGERAVGRGQAPHRRRRTDRERVIARLAQDREPAEMIDVCVRHEHARNRRPAPRLRLQRRERFDLLRDVGRDVDEPPRFAVARNRKRRRGAAGLQARARGGTIRARAVPLRDAAARRGAEHANDHRKAGSSRRGDHAVPESSRSR